MAKTGIMEGPSYARVMTSPVVLTAYADQVVNSEAVQEASMLTTLPIYDIPRCQLFAFSFSAKPVRINVVVRVL